MNSNESVKDLSIAHLQLIVSLIKHGNACVASDELGMSQSTISYHLRRLRSIFADDMFVRTGKGLKPTERCLQVGHFARDLINRVEEELIHGNDFAPSQIERELSLVADDTACGWFAKLFNDLQKTLPKVALCARPWYLNAMKDLDKGAIHFGIHIMPNGTKGIYDVEVAPCHRLCVVREGHPLCAQGKVTLEDLAMYPVILNDLAGWNNNGNSLIERVLKQHNLQPNFVGRMGYVSSIFSALHNSNAITYTSAVSLPKDLSGLTLLKGPAEIDEIECNYRLYISKTRYGSQETNYLIEFIFKSFTEYVNCQYQRDDVVSIIGNVVAGNKEVGDNI
ncbi:LysR family transcriptional regulator [Shewanella fidelis]|uniref:LysR family transcriptional regulator n=1 Tax=Shewanella fidelis TaxID=173509 RepID=UPI0004B55A64|nr:LysR family transcriptional regulator [Shewanella fidelis]